MIKEQQIWVYNKIIKDTYNKINNLLEKEKSQKEEYKGEKVKDFYKYPDNFDINKYGI